MDLTGICCVFWSFSLIIIGPAVQLMFPSAAAESPSALTCDVTQQADGSIKYRLSRPPSSSNCKGRETCWEDQNKTVIARDFTPDPQLVQNLTNQFIILKDCRDYLHYTKDCFGDFEEAHCRVNCSLLLDKDHPTTVNSTLTCLFGIWRPDPLKVGFGIAGILVAVVVLVGLYCWKSGRFAAMTASYTPANYQIKMESGDVQRKDII